MPSCLVKEFTVFQVDAVVGQIACFRGQDVDPEDWDGRCGAVNL